MLILGILGYIFDIYKGKPTKPHIHPTASATTAAHQPISSLQVPRLLEMTNSKDFNEKPVKRLQNE
jgi:hypothetical protein